MEEDSSQRIQSLRLSAISSSYLVSPSLLGNLSPSLSFLTDTVASSNSCTNYSLSLSFSLPFLSLSLSVSLSHTLSPDQWNLSLHSFLLLPFSLTTVQLIVIESKHNSEVTGLIPFCFRNFLLKHTKADFTVYFIGPLEPGTIFQMSSFYTPTHTRTHAHTHTHTLSLSLPLIL